MSVQALSQTPTPVNEPVLEYREGSPEKISVKKEIAKQKANPITMGSYINGQWVEGTEGEVVMTSPQNHQFELGRASLCSAERVSQAIQGTLEARKDWSHMPWEARASVFLKAADLLTTSYRPIFTASTLLGQSKTIFQAEIDAACELIDFLRFNAHYVEQIYTQQPASSPGMWNRSEVRGLEGFVFAATPFNFTAIAMNLAAAPALMGCGVVWKPALNALPSAYWTVKLLEEAGLPPGVINIVLGEPKTVGDVCLKHRDLSGIHFTGSTRTFQHLWREVGNNIDQYASYPRVVGETGGKDFVIAHPDCEEDDLVTALIRGAFEYQGQKCSAASRAYIPKSVWGRIKTKLVEETQSIAMGDPENFSNFVSAVIDENSFDRIEGYISRAKESSETDIIAGGECDKSTGYFVRPTIIETTNPKYESMVEEIFGPVLTVFVYDDNKLDETLKLVDESTSYALTGAIFARDRKDILNMTNALEHAAGNFYINDKPTGAVVGQQPFGGSRASGTNDKAGSLFNLVRWTSMRTIKETFRSAGDYRYPFMDCKD